MIEKIKKIVDKDKFNKFCTIADQLYTQEYIGIDEYNNDKIYEKELTESAAVYMISIFHCPEYINEAKENLIKVMNKKQPNTKSKILEIVF